MATTFYDQEKAAAAIRAAMALKMIRQKDLADQVGMPRTRLNYFLRRKINLVEGDLEKILDMLNLEKFRATLSVSAEGGL